MALKLKNLTMRNFLSIGNNTQVINLNREEFILVLGENLDLGGEDSGNRNGAGKTCILNAISYALYSWPIRAGTLKIPKGLKITPRN